MSHGFMTLTNLIKRLRYLYLRSGNILVNLKIKLKKTFDKIY